MEPEAAARAAHPRPELEQAQAELLDSGMGKLSAAQHAAAKQHQQVVGQRMELQAKSVGAVGGAGQAVGRDIALELLDEVFGLTPLVVPGEDLRGRADPVGDQEAEIGAERGVLALDHDPARGGPTVGLRRSPSTGAPPVRSHARVFRRAGAAARPLARAWDCAASRWRRHSPRTRRSRAGWACKSRRRRAPRWVAGAGPGANAPPPDATAAATAGSH